MRHRKEQESMINILKMHATVTTCENNQITGINKDFKVVIINMFKN